MTLIDRALAFRQQVKLLTTKAAAAGTFAPQVEAFVAEAKLLAADGLTWAEAGQLFTALIALAVAAAQQLSNPGTEKKQWVLDAVGYLFDAIGPMLPLPAIVQPFRAWIRPYVRRLVLMLADGAIEAIYARLAAA